MEISSKHQTSSSREAPSAKLPSHVDSGLEFGVWCFSGAWMLMLGAFSWSGGWMLALGASLHRSFDQLQQVVIPFHRFELGKLLLHIFGRAEKEANVRLAQHGRVVEGIS